MYDGRANERGYNGTLRDIQSLGQKIEKEEKKTGAENYVSSRKPKNFLDFFLLLGIPYTKQTVTSLPEKCLKINMKTHAEWRI